jgi:hypothetical protein
MKEAIMRTAVAIVASALILSCQFAVTAMAQNNPILRKNNDAGASSTVIKKNEPPISATPAPRNQDKPRDVQHQ